MLYEPPPQIQKFNWVWAKWLYGAWETFFKYGPYPPLSGETGVVSYEYPVGDVRRYGATGDGVTDETAFLQSASDNNFGAIKVPKGRYLLTSGEIDINYPMVLTGDGPASVLSCDTSASPDNNILRLEPTSATEFAFTATLSIGDRAFTLSSVAGLAVGDHIFLALGEDPYDPAEEHLRIWTIINDITSLTVTVSRPMPEDVNGTSHKLIKYATMPHGSVVQNFAIAYETGAGQDQGIILKRAESVAVRNIYGESHLGAIVDMRECSNIEIDGLTSVSTDGSIHSTAGRLLAAWGCENVAIRNVYGHSLEGAGIFFESQMRGALIENVSLHLNPDYSASAMTAIHIAGHSTGVKIKNYTYSGGSNDTALSVVETSEVATENVFLETIPAAFPLKYHSGDLKYNELTYRHHKTASISIRIAPSMSSKAINLPEGMYKRVFAYVNDKTNITSTFLTAGGQGADILSQLSAGSMVEITSPGAFCGSSYQFNDDDNKLFTVTSGSTNEGTIIRLFIEYITQDGADDDFKSKIDAEGKISQRGQVTISNTATNATVTMPTALSDTDYLIQLTPVAQTGTPAAGSNRILRVGKASNLFTAHVEVAPGSSNSVTFDWQVVER